jgi:hypothetical protein
VFATQYRLVTKEDHENYIKQTFSSLVRDVRVVNNWDYLNGHFKYNVEDLGLKSNNKDPRTLLNQVNFADSCDFNNLYCYVVPRLEAASSGVARTSYLTPSQKNAIINGLRDNKTMTTEIIVVDPVYIGVDLGIYSPTTEELTVNIKDVSVLKVLRDSSSTRSFESIQNAAYTLINGYFKTFELGSAIDISGLINDLLNLEGVSKIYTERTDTGLIIEGLNFILWNPIYPETDISTAGSDVTLPYYKYPYLSDPVTFLEKIVVVSETTLTGSTEY